MRERAKNAWHEVTTSLWFVPTVLICAAFALAIGLTEIDARLGAQDGTSVPWLFRGTADAARTILSVVAGSLATVISIAFSFTMVALQQASTQFTPRVLRSFTADRGNQIVLGSYIATFVYALLVLRTVRSAVEDRTNVGFVPGLSVTVAIGLAVVCLALLIYFIHHTAHALQVATIMDNVRRELRVQIAALYPSCVADADPAPFTTLTAALALPETVRPVHSTTAGFVRRIDAATIHVAASGAQWVLVRPQVGEYVTTGSVLVEIADGSAEDTDTDDRFRGAFVIAPTRTAARDPLFGVRQLVDIALRALSPGINDMTTAEYALYHLGDALGDLATRAFPSPLSTAPDGTPVLFARPTWDDFVALAFDQIRHAAADDLHVTRRLLHVLQELALRIPTEERAAAIHGQSAAIEEGIARRSWADAEKKTVTHAARAIAEVLRSRAWEHHEPPAVGATPDRATTAKEGGLA